MSYDCSFCDFNAPTRARYMRHLGTQKHARNYLEGTKNSIIEKSKKEKMQEEKEEEFVQEETMEEMEYNPQLTTNFFLDIETLRFIKRWSDIIELSPIFVWIMTLFNKLNTIIPNRTTIESNNEGCDESNVLGH